MKKFAVVAFAAIAFSVYGAGAVVDKGSDAKPAVVKDVKAEAKQDGKPEVKITDLPGITTPDRTPQGCVNCHANHPEMKMDFRLTTILAKWKNGADPEILKKAQAAVPAGRTLIGKHPDIQALVKVIPNDCLMCHNSESTIAPPFNKMLHAIHIVGGKENHFFTKANGTCTSCHKIDEKTGAWHLGSGEEKE